MKKYFLTPLFILLGVLSITAQNVIRWSAEMADAENGNVDLVVTATLGKGWYIYDIDIPEGGPFATELEIEELKGAEPVGKFRAVDSDLQRKFDETFGMEIGYYYDKATFVQSFRLTDKDAFVLNGEARGQACNNTMCTPPISIYFDFTSQDLPAGAKATPGSAGADNGAKPSGTLPESVNTAGTDAEGQGQGDAVTGIEGPATDGTAVSALASDPELWRPVITELREYGAAGSIAGRSLIWIFILGFGGGLLALLTPCVWPIIPMTVSFFLKSNQTKKGKAVRDAIIYGLSIIIIYVGLGLLITGIFGASALNDLATSAGFNLFFFALLVFFAISFFGAFELTLPSKWTNKMDSKADSTTGLISIFFMAFTLVLVSFSCTGPIIGTLLVDAASSGAIIAPAIGMLGFAIALAIPFSLFAIFPSWLKSMPKSGGWLNSVKVVLGFLELALALKFFSVADLAYGWRILDREVFLVLWIVIFALLGLYLLGKIKFRHDSDVKYVGVPRLSMSIISFAFAIYLIPGLWGAPLKAISAFSPPIYTQDFNLYDGIVHPQFYDYEAGMEYAARVNKPVLLDFSGLGCVNCRKMEAAVWTDARVKSTLDNDFVVIALMVDDKTRLPEIIEFEENGRRTRIKTVGDKWSFLQRHKFGTSSQPYYIILDNEGNPIAPSYAFKEDVNAYLKFLGTGLSNYKK